MAITTPSGNPVLGIKYTKITDSSADWASVANNTFFYDKAEAIVHYKDNSGTVLSVFDYKAYADSLVVGLWDDRGNFNASVNAYPTSGGSGTAGAILKGDIWTVTVAGTLPAGQNVEVGDLVRALVDTPGNIQANWAITQNNIAYGKAGIYNSAGTPTYYSSLQTAINAASAGDTVQLFTNVTENISLKNGVNINGNGFTLTGTGSTPAVVNSGSIIVRIINMRIKQSNATFDGIRLIGTCKLELEGTSVENDLGNTINLSINAEIKGGISKIGSAAIQGGKLYNHICYPLGHEGIQVINGGYVENCKVYNFSQTVASLAINASNSQIFNCFAYNLLGGGINSNESDIANCTFYSRDNWGIGHNGSKPMINCNGYSLNNLGAWISYGIGCNGYSVNGNWGLNVLLGVNCNGYCENGMGLVVNVDDGSEPKLFNCTGIGKNIGGQIFGGGLSAGVARVFNCSFEALEDSADSHALVISDSYMGTHHIVGNFLSAPNAGSYAIYSDSAINAYISDNKFYSQNGVHPNITQLETRTADEQGNMFIK